MLFSSIEEAWVTPNYTKVEQFTSQLQSPLHTQLQSQCSYNCDELIKKILSCPSCYDALLKKLPPIYSRENQFLNNFYQKYFVDLNPRIKDKLVNFLLIIAVVLVVMLLQ